MRLNSRADEGLDKVVAAGDRRLTVRPRIGLGPATRLEERAGNPLKICLFAFRFDEAGREAIHSSACGFD